MVEGIYERIVYVLRGTDRALKPHLRRLLRLAALPWYYATGIDWRECDVSRLQAASDLFYIFFVLRYYPDNYAACRLWEQPRRDWVRYYGSSYNPYPRHRLQREVQRPEFEILFEDKQVASLLCAGAGLPQPRVFGVVDPGPGLTARVGALLDAAAADAAMLKPVHGSAGQGVVRIERRGAGLVVRDGRGETPLDDYRLQERALLQEVVCSAPEILQLAPGALSTIRVITLLTRAGTVLVLGASMRFGIGASVVDNWSAGGVAVGIDVESGRLHAVGFDKRGRRHLRHPDTGLAFGDTPIPHWSEVLDLARRTQSAFGFFRLFGVDVAVGAGGPCLIEINALPDIVFQEQTSGPIFDRAGVLEAFADYDLLINTKQQDLLGQVRRARGEA